MILQKAIISRKIIYLAFVFILMGMLASCGKEQNEASIESEISENSSENDKAVDDSAGSTEEYLTSEEDMAEAVRERFGENCIVEQTFEVELSEYSGKVSFVPLAPSEDNRDFCIQIIREGEVLTSIDTYVPAELAEEKFSSLDAVSFYDVNYDGNTDIVMIETYGSTSFAAVYYGFDANADDFERNFMIQEQLSETISGQAESLSVSEIRSFLADGKKNGEFNGYQEAYKAVSKLCELESAVKQEYNLIYFDEDDIPELVVGVEGYYTSLYTYNDGKVYALMDCWPYGAMGNAGYEYSPGKNSLRNYNSDFAGAILYTTYMAVSDQYSMDTVVQIETYNFDDVNGNGIPDENETESIGYYSVSYINGAEVTEEECAAYDLGGYEFIETTMSLEDLRAKLNEE